MKAEIYNTIFEYYNEQEKRKIAPDVIKSELIEKIELGKIEISKDRIIIFE